MKIKCIKNNLIEYAEFELIKNGNIIDQGYINTFNLETKQCEKEKSFCELNDAILAFNDEEKYVVNDINTKEQAIDKLLKVLPENIELLCCHTCRFGHANPFGDELFLCLIDEGEIVSKESIINLFEAKFKEIDEKGRTHKFIQKEVDEYCDRYQKCASELYRYK